MTLSAFLFADPAVQFAAILPYSIALVLILVVLMERRRHAQESAALNGQLVEQVEQAQVNASLLDRLHEGVVVCDAATLAIRFQSAPATRLIGDRTRLPEQIAGAIGAGPRRRHTDDPTAGLAPRTVRAGQRVLLATPHSMGPRTLVVTLTDVTERQRERDVLAHLSTHDRTTGLVDRKSLRHLLHAAISPDGREPFALLIVDIDDFGAVNRTHGEEIGDRLLGQVARRLRRNVREGDVVGRFGGASFAVIEAGARRPCDIEALAQRIQDMAAQPIVVDGRDLRISVSIGGVLSGPGGPHATVDALLVEAHAALALARHEEREAVSAPSPSPAERGSTQRQTPSVIPTSRTQAIAEAAWP